ncbi:MAG: PDZ domain-containing protein, partial [Thermoguttaceae bacterium]
MITRMAPLPTAWLLWMVVLAPAMAEDVELLEQRAFRAAVDRVAGSVVRIETIGGLPRVDKVLFGDGPTTGLVVDPDGYIISSAFNFVNRPTSILVRLSNDTVRPATLVATDHSRMLVLLKIEVDEPLPVPQITPIEEMRIGQWAIAVGRSFEGERPGVAVGILSAMGRIWGKAIQTDAAVSPNNYGGPLIDVQGRVLGVLVPLSPQATGSMAGIEWYDSGIGFAIPGQQIMEVLPRLKKGEDLHPGILGIALGGKNLAIAEPRIAACRPYSPAAEAGLMPGDRIVEIEGQPIRHAAGVKAQLNRRYAGTSIDMVVLRDDKRLNFSLELVEKLPPYRHPFLGILPMRDDAADSGVRVRYVYAASPAAAANIVAGDRLVSLDDKPIESAAELRGQIATFQIDDEVKIEIGHGDQTRTVVLKLASLPEDIPSTQLPSARTKIQDVAAAEPREIP